MKKNNNPLADLFASLGTGAEMPKELADQLKKMHSDMGSNKSEIPGLDGLNMESLLKGNPAEMMSGLADILNTVKKIDKKDVADRSGDDASTIRAIFKDIPEINKLISKLSDEEINAGPSALMELMHKKHKKAVKKAKAAGIDVSDMVNPAVDFMKFATKLVDDMDAFEKDHGIDTSKPKEAKEENEKYSKIKRSPLAGMVIGLIVEMGGDPLDHIKQLNKITEDPSSLHKRAAKILTKVTRGKIEFLNTYAYLCSPDFHMSKLTEAIAKDKQNHVNRQAEEAAKVESKSTDHQGSDWKAGKAAKKIAKIKKQFKSGERTPAETIDAMIALTESAGSDLPALIEILNALVDEIPTSKK